MFPRSMLSGQNIPTVGKPGKILGTTIIVVVQCQQCTGGDDIALVQAQPAPCPTCGAVFSLESVAWQRAHPVPKIELTATPPRAKAFD